MQLQFYMGCQMLLAILADAGHVDRAIRVWLACNSGAIGNEKHMIFHCAALSIQAAACRLLHTLH